MEIALVVAHDLNGVIGIDNRLPWSIPEDLGRFKKLTEYHAIIMGRKTWESLGETPLKNRRNMILSHKYAEGVYIGFNAHLEARSMEEAIHYFRITGAQKVFIIGGSDIFSEGMKYASKIYRTQVQWKVEGEGEKAYFKEFNFNVYPGWELVGSESTNPAIVFEEYHRVAV
jgi:dihydrofolate reductase